MAQSGSSVSAQFSSLLASSSVATACGGASVTCEQVRAQLGLPFKLWRPLGHDESPFDKLQLSGSLTPRVSESVKH